MYNLMLIDDHPIVRLGIKSLLESHADYQICWEAGSRCEALTILAQESPYLVIVDLVLGRDDGLEFVKELRTIHPCLKILVMTMQDESVYAERVLRAGADGFITKQDATEHLLEAVETILSGDIYLSRVSSARLLGRVLRESSSGGDSKAGALSDRELHVFQMIGTGLATKEIAYSLQLSPKTIETYRENIKRKLNLKNADALRQSALSWVETGKV